MSKNPFDNEAYATAYEKEYMRESVLHYPPLWVTLGICSPCPYHCDFCAYHSLDARKISKVYNVPFVMPLEQAKSLIDFFHAGGVPKIHICATGEPLYHPDFFAILDYVIAKYGSVSFQSNFPPDLVEKRNAIENIIKRLPFISYIAIDLMHNQNIKGGKDGEIYHILKRLQPQDRSLFFGSFLLTRKNWRDLENVVRAIHAHKLNIPLKTVRVFPHGINEFTAPENAWKNELLNVEEREGLMEIFGLARSLGVKLHLFNEDESIECSVFWKKIQIWPTRISEKDRLDNIIPHACNAVVLGDIGSLGYVSDYNDIFSLWNNRILQELREKIINNKYPDAHCVNCPYKISKNTSLKEIDMPSRLCS